jgi:hypothetical protein
MTGGGPSRALGRENAIRVVREALDKDGPWDNDGRAVCAVLALDRAEQRRSRSEATLPAPDNERVVATPERLEAAVYGDEQATHDLLMACAEAGSCLGTGRYELVMRPVDDDR